MAYDTNVTSSTLQLEQKNRVFRVNFERPPITGDNSLTAQGYIQEDTIDVTPGSETSSSVVVSSTWWIGLTKPQIMDLPNANSFLNGLITLLTDLKKEYRESGSLATGSIKQVN